MTVLPPSPPTPSPLGERGRRTPCSAAPEATGCANGDSVAPLSPRGEGPGVRGSRCDKKLRPDTCVVNPWFTNSVPPFPDGQIPSADQQGACAASLDDGARRQIMAGPAQPAAGRFEISPQGAPGTLRCRFPVPCGAAGGGSHRAGATSCLACPAGHGAAGAWIWGDPPRPRTGRQRFCRLVGRNRSHCASQALTRARRQASPLSFPVRQERHFA